MRKLALLRQFIMQSPLALEESQLHVSSQSGTVSTRAGLKKIHINYPARVLIQDYTGTPEAAAYILKQFLDQYEPQRPDDAIKFIADILDSERVDLEFTIPLSGSVLVKEGEGETTLKHCKDPTEYSYTGTGKLHVESEEEPIANWQATPPEQLPCTDCHLPDSLG